MECVVNWPVLAYQADRCTAQTYLVYADVSTLVLKSPWYHQPLGLYIIVITNLSDLETNTLMWKAPSSWSWPKDKPASRRRRTSRKVPNCCRASLLFKNCGWQRHDAWLFYILKRSLNHFNQAIISIQVATAQSSLQVWDTHPEMARGGLHCLGDQICKSEEV